MPVKMNDKSKPEFKWFRPDIRPKHYELAHLAIVNDPAQPHLRLGLCVWNNGRFTAINEEERIDVIAVYPWYDRLDADILANAIQTDIDWNEDLFSQFETAWWDEV